MLYDPKWEQKQDDLEFQGVTLCGFIAWLEMQDPACIYEYMFAHTCAAGQYKTYMGHEDPIVNFDCLGPATGAGRNWLEGIVIEHPRTFGAALERARAAAQ